MRGRRCRPPIRCEAIGLLLTVATVIVACGHATTTPRQLPTLTGVPVPTAAPSSALQSPSSAATSQPAVSYPLPCGQADPGCLSLPVVMKRDIDFTNPVPCGGDLQCLLKIDSFALPGGDGKRPIVVMIPGGPLPPGNRSYLWNLARVVAGRGAVVYTADYRSSPRYGGGYPTTFADVACAIRFARHQATSLGGDPSKVTLVAHSFGGFPAAVVALSPTDFGSSAEPGCLTTSGSGRPNSFVGIAGVYSLDRIGPDFLAGFFGGDRTQRADAWAAGDVALLAKLNRRLPPVRLVVGTQDFVAPAATADELAVDLSQADERIQPVVLNGATHDTILDRPETLDAILGAIQAAR